MANSTQAKCGRSSPTRWIIAILLAGILLAGALLLMRNPSAEESQPFQRTAIPVETVIIGTMTVDETVRGVGTLRASAAVAIAPEVGGRIRSIHFQEGGEVEEGQVLFQLDDEKLGNQLSARYAGLQAAGVRAENARRTFQRHEQLLEQGVIAEETFDRIKAEMDLALADVDRLLAEVALMEEQLRDAVVRAPFAGRISERQVDRGAFVAVGQALARLYQVDPLEITFSVPERYIGRVQRGQGVLVYVAAFGDENFSGEIDFISPAVDEATRSLRVKAVLPNTAGRLKPGAFARTFVTVGRRENQTVAPEESLVATRQGYIVYVVRDGVAEAREIRTGIRRDGLVEVIDGIASGEEVVRSGHLRLSDGERVEVVGSADGEENRDLAVANPKLEYSSETGGVVSR